MALCVCANFARHRSRGNRQHACDHYPHDDVNHTRGLQMSIPPSVFFDTSWQGEYDRRKFLCENADTPWLKQHYARELAVMEPTLKALHIDFGAPPPVSMSLHDSPAAAPPAAPDVVVDPPPDERDLPLRRKSVALTGDSANPFSLAAQVGPLSVEEGRDMAVAVARQLMKDFGFRPAHAAGIAGNLWHESAGMNANVNEFGSDPSWPTYGAPNRTLFGYGWAQWTGTRKTDYLNFCRTHHLDPASPYANYAMLKFELENSESATVPAVKSVSTPEDAATMFRRVFERATIPHDSKRVAAARELFEYLA